MNCSIQQVLRELDPEEPCLLAEHGVVTRADLLGRAAAWGPQLHAGLRVALDGLSPLRFVEAVTALDGGVEALLPLPASLDASARDSLLEAGRCNTVLSESGRLEIWGGDAAGVPAEVGSTEWLLATSGTTGVPKLVSHTLASLTRTVVRRADRAAAFTWGLLYDPARFAGLQVTLQALLSGSPLVVAQASDLESQVAALLRHPVNALSGTPSLWRRLLMDGRLDGCDLRQITLGGEIVDQAILDALRSRYPQARITHIYASTEAGTGFSVKDGRAGFPAAWLDDPAAPVGLRIDARGHLLIRAPLRAGGEEVGRRTDAEGYLDTEDRVAVAGDRVVFRGRASGAINVGGNKVQPEEVELCLREVAGVWDVRVQAARSSILGNLVAAEVLAAPGTDQPALRQAIQRHARAALPAWQVPAVIRFVETLDVTPAGKVDRVAR
jgi:acyl-CoA synthetase (AMP-forming)/AMP-acid ligase II